MSAYLIFYIKYMSVHAQMHSLWDTHTVNTALAKCFRITASASRFTWCVYNPSLMYLHSYNPSAPPSNKQHREKQNDGSMFYIAIKLAWRLPLIQHLILTIFADVRLLACLFVCTCKCVHMCGCMWLLVCVCVCVCACACDTWASVATVQ